MIPSDEVLEKESVVRLLNANFTPAQIVAKFPNMNINTVKSWKRRYCTEIETVETITTVSKKVSTIHATDETDEVQQGELVEPNAPEQRATIAPDATSFVQPAPTVAPVAPERNATFEPVETRVLQPVAPDVTEVETGVNLNYNRLIPIGLLASVIGAIKFFSVNEIQYVLEQISSVAGVAVATFAVVLVVAPLVLLANATQVQTVALLQIIRFVIVATVAMQVFCCVVSVSQQLQQLPRMQQTLRDFTFFSNLSFSWSYAVFRGLVDISLEFVLLEIYKGNEQAVEHT